MREIMLIVGCVFLGGVGHVMMDRIDQFLSQNRLRPYWDEQEETTQNSNGSGDLPHYVA